MPPIPQPLEPIATKATKPPAAPPGRAFDDVDAFRSVFFDKTKSAIAEVTPVKVGKYTLALSDIDYDDPPELTPAERKKAILTNTTAVRRLRGNISLLEDGVPEPISQKRVTIARVPKPTDNGTFVINGVEWTLGNQLRLDPGAYVRRTHTGDVEAHVNVQPGTGPVHHYTVDPKSGVFKMRIGQSNIPLLPLLYSMGAKDDQIKEAWGLDLLNANKLARSGDAISKLMTRVLRAPKLGETQTPEQLVAAFRAMKFNPEVTTRTLGKPYANVDVPMILDTTRKILDVRKGLKDPDTRDDMVFQRLYGPEDLVSERARQLPGVLRKLAFRASQRKSVEHIPADFFGPNLMAAIMNSGIGGAAEEVNPVELLGHQTRVSRLGVGGISSPGAAPDETKSVLPSQYGFIDFVYSPESERAGLDMRLAAVTRKGDNGKIYTRVRNRKTGQIEWVSPAELADSTQSFAMENLNSEFVRAIVRGRLDFVPGKNVQYETPYADDAYNPLSQLVPFRGGMKGQRLSMAARMLAQSVPLVKAEAPLVQAMDPEDPDSSMDRKYGTRVGAIRAPQAGEVVDVTPDAVSVKYADGKVQKHLLAQTMPYNRKTYLTQTPTVQIGQRIRPGDLLARSNYTDKDGTLALGVNLRTAYMPAKGYSFEDAFVVSESAARDKLTSSHAYQHSIPFDHSVKNNKSTFVSLFPSTYDRKKLDTLDDDGIVKVGTRLQKGDPIVLRAGQVERAHNKIARGKFGGYTDQTETWEHQDEGIVTDVERTDKGVVAVVTSDHPAREGDKIVIRHGSKGLIGRIVPDDEMPKDSEGRPMEALINPMTIPTRRNPSQVAETILGKIAAKTGKPYKVPSFFTGGEYAEDYHKSMLDFARREAANHGISPEEDLTDPLTGRKIPNVLTGMMYFLKLHHLAEHKAAGRGLGAYGQDEAPSKTGGPVGSAKRFSLSDTEAALAHGAFGLLRDVRTIRSQRNTDYWAKFMAGQTPADPTISSHHDRFMAMLRASGINPIRKNRKTQLMALTDRDVEKLAGNREIESGDTVNWDERLSPVKGGLFDESLTGGHGNKTTWAKISLPEPIPSPAFEEPIRWTLGLTEKSMRNILAGREELNGKSGPEALRSALESIDLNRAIEETKVQWRKRKGVGRSQAARRWSMLEHARRQGLHPKDWMVSAIPVLPTAYRPVSLMQETGRPLVHDANALYKDVLSAKSALAALRDKTSDLGDERLALYDSVKAVVGMGDPITPKNQDRQVRGIMKTIFGAAGPKYSMAQRQLLGSTVDTVGRGSIVPNPELDMDEIGLPEDKVWESYQPFIIRRLVHGGVPGPRAYQMVNERSEKARAAMLEELDRRPVVVVRAPVLHKYGQMGFKPKIVKGDQIQMPVLVTKGFGADFDGDAVSFHVPVSEDAVKDVYSKMLPSKNLHSVRSGKVHQLPTNEFLAGLYQASKDRQEGQPRVFATIRDLREAFARGDVGHDDPVTVLDK